MITDSVSDTLKDLILSRMSHLADLDLSENQLTDITGIKIGEAIPYNKSLIRLDISSNSFK